MSSERLQTNATKGPADRAVPARLPLSTRPFDSAVRPVAAPADIRETGQAGSGAGANAARSVTAGNWDFGAVSIFPPGRQIPDAGERLDSFPHHRVIADAMGMADFKAPAAIDPSVRTLGAEAATQDGKVRFARFPSLEVAAHEAAHVIQGRRPGRRGDVVGADRHASAVAGRLVRGLGARDLMTQHAMVSAPALGAQLFVPAGSAPATHKVVAGETLQTISRDIYGDSRYYIAIWAANLGTLTFSALGNGPLTPGAVLNLPDRPDPADPWVNPFVSGLLRKGGIWTQAQAEATLLAYSAESVANREAMVAHYLPLDHIPALLQALPANSTQAGGKFEKEARDLLQRIQRVGARADAASQGLATEDDMAKAQANEMIARNKAAAAAALPVGAPPPTTAQVAAQQSAQVAKGSIAPQTATMSAARETALNTKLNAKSIPDFVKWVTANHPTLGLTAANLRADARAIFMRGARVLAFADGTNLRAVVGEPFVSMVDANPAYALPVVVHEVWGHNTYEGQGKYGSPGAAYGLDLYDKAAAKMPGYTKPTGQGRKSEVDNFGYQETEMYSWMRMVPFFTPVTKAHAALASLNVDPVPQIQARIRLIQSAFEPKVGRAMVRGLFVRFKADPTVAPAAMTAFRAGVTAIFSKADTAIILA